MNDARPECNPSDGFAWPLAKIPPPKWEPFFPSRVTHEATPEITGDPDNRIRKLDFGAMRHPIRHIIVLKLDHYGDFIIGLPALRALRDAFPDAVIRLVCGKWNERNARDCGLVDEVRCYNFFLERPKGAPQQLDSLREFDAAAAGHYDIAIDLRVDEDTRHLLGRIDASLRCGIGSEIQFPLLDIALPYGHYGHSLRTDMSASTAGFMFLAPDKFNSNLPFKEPLHHFGPLVRGDIFHSPYVELPTGKLRAEVALTVRGHVPGLLPASITLEAVRDGQIVARKVFGRLSVFRLRHHPVALEFDNPWQESGVEFRARVEGRPARGTVEFSGIVIHQIDADVMGIDVAVTGRFRASELHIGERLSLLVTLVRERTADLYSPLNYRPTRDADATAGTTRTAGRLRIAVAPFSNSETRNWPASYYGSLVSLLLERIACDVILLGTASQVTDALEITDRVQSPHLVDLIGRTSWDELQDVLRTVDLVICNNSGIAHLAAALGTKVLALYSGSHQPREWGPRGMRATALMYDIHCSPCGFERLRDCTAGHACMRQITPLYVFSQVQAMLEPEYAITE